jgi:hypothetical protein
VQPAFAGEQRPKIHPTLIIQGHHLTIEERRRRGNPVKKE